MNSGSLLAGLDYNKKQYTSIKPKCLLKEATERSSFNPVSSTSSMYCSNEKRPVTDSMSLLAWYDMHRDVNEDVFQHDEKQQ